MAARDERAVLRSETGVVGRHTNDRQPVKRSNPRAGHGELKPLVGIELEHRQIAFQVTCRQRPSMPSCSQVTASLPNGLKPGRKPRLAWGGCGHDLLGGSA